MLESGGDGVAEECEDAAVLLAAFAGTALFLSSVGIYAVTRYMASRRIQEFGIRMALGAKHSDILKLMLPGA